MRVFLLPHCDHRKCAEFCIINTLFRGSRGHFLGFQPYISRILHRVTPFIGLRGSLADNRTAGMLHVLLATLAVWFAVAFCATIPFARASFPRIFNTALIEASYATALVL